MQYGIGVEYGLHCLLYLVDRPKGDALGIKEMAKFQGVSETYLSKIFTKLRKHGIVQSAPGVKGGYELAKDPKDISFWDVIEAIEGASYNFQCKSILQNIIINKEDHPTDEHGSCVCNIKYVMYEAEDRMRDFLRSKSLRWLQKDVAKVTTETYKTEEKQWFEQAKK